MGRHLSLTLFKYENGWYLENSWSFGILRVERGATVSHGFRLTRTTGEGWRIYRVQALWGLVDIDYVRRTPE